MTGPRSVYIHPFDNPLIWSGHATIIDEVKKLGLHPDAVILSVGGGGLLCGIIEGLYRNNMPNVPILAVETEGADSLSACMKAGQHVEIDNIKSIATTLGAKKVAKAAYDWCHKYEVVSHVVSDTEAIESCLKFSNDHRILVEPACGASLAALYHPVDFLKDRDFKAFIESNGDIAVEIEHKDRVLEVLSILRHECVDYDSIDIRRSNLEEVFLHLTGSKLSEGD